MMKKIRKYYRIKFELTSPLSVGCGEKDITDRDIVLDGRGYPYIPGSALAGAYRKLFSQETADHYFGLDLTEERLKKCMDLGKNVLTESNVAVYDAVILNPDERVITTRDMVALDEFKVSIDDCKFDFQVLEPGVHFVTYLEQSMNCSEEQYVLQEIVHAWQKEQIQLGAKTGRGYGHTRVLEVAECGFNLADQSERDTWLEFDMYEDAGWNICGTFSCLSALIPGSKKYNKLEIIYKKLQISVKATDELCVLLDLVQKSGISVRKYSTDVDKADYMQMTRKDGTPFIPGTSWAGAFRAQFEKLDVDFARKKKLTELFFGKVKSNDDMESHKTRVTFSESELHGGIWKTYTRNAIDRFTGGTVDGALYTEKSYFGGNTQLKITCDTSGLDKKIIRHFVSVLAAAILDLDRGFMAVGGLTAVGHGIFRVEEVTVDGQKTDFKQLKPEEQYSVLRCAMSGEEERK